MKENTHVHPPVLIAVQNHVLVQGLVLEADLEVDQEIVLEDDSLDHLIIITEELITSQDSHLMATKIVDPKEISRTEIDIITSIKIIRTDTIIAEATKTDLAK